MWALKIFFPLPVFGKIRIKRKQTGTGNRLPMIWWKKMHWRKILYLYYLFTRQGLGAGDCWLLQVRSKFSDDDYNYEKQIFSWNLFLFKDSGGGLLSFVRLRVNKKTEFWKYKFTQPDTSQRTGSRRLLASLSNPAAAPHCPTALPSPVRVSLLWTHFKFECWCWWMKL